MYKKKAKLLFKHNSFDIIEEGDLQEAYFSPEQVKKRFQKLKK